MALKTLLTVMLSLSLAGCSLTGAGNKKEAEEERRIFGFVEEYNPLVKEAQNKLVKAGFHPGPIDGRMGWQTREAVKSFQKANAIKVTGFVNSMTWEKLDISNEASQASVSTPAPKKDLKQETRKEKKEARTEPAPAITAKEKSRERAEEYRLTSKSQIKNMQQALKNAGFDPGPIDGKMGSKTKDAIKRFQGSRGMAKNGTMGPETWKELSVYLTKE